MYMVNLELSQLLKEHPVLKENASYRCSYVNLLEYMVRAFSQTDIWANQVLELYKEVLLKDVEDYSYSGFVLSQNGKSVVETRFKHFKFYSYRYCVVFDCVFMNAINNRKRGEKIYNKLSVLYNGSHGKELRRLFDAMYDRSLSFDGFDQVSYVADCYKRNMDFISNKPLCVLITATMSAGKSTLINALVGKKVCKTQNAACTAKIHYIKAKAFEDGYCYEYDYDLKLNADTQTLMEDNSLNKENNIYVSSFFRTIGQEPKRIWLIDTPGVNFSMNSNHRKITEECISGTKADLLIYVLNGENMGTNDDRSHLEFVLKNYSGRILFLVNKLDRFNIKEDSVEETISEAIADLTQMGFESPTVLPISSAAAFLAKMEIFGEALDEYEQHESNTLTYKLMQEGYLFDTYYPDNAQKLSHEITADAYPLLYHCGILQLENIIYGLRG